MKNVVLFLLLVSMLFVAPIVAGEARPTTPPYQGPPGGYGSPGTPDNIPPGMPSPFPIRPPQHWYRVYEPRRIPENPWPYRLTNPLPINPKTDKHSGLFWNEKH